MNEQSQYKSILDELELIADKPEFEKHALEREEFADEVLCILFDDLSVERLLTSSKSLPKGELEILTQFVDAANKALREMPVHIVGQHLVKNPHWQEAQFLANALIEMRRK